MGYANPEGIPPYVRPPLDECNQCYLCLLCNLSMKQTPTRRQNNIGRQWWFEGLCYATGCQQNLDCCLKQIIERIATLKQKGMVFHRLLLTTKYRQKCAVYVNLFVKTSTRVEENWLRTALRVHQFECTMIGPATKQATILECLDAAVVVFDETADGKL